jgi:hypothetical protein
MVITGFSHSADAGKSKIQGVVDPAAGGGFQVAMGGI